MKILKDNYNEIKDVKTNVDLRPYPRKHICDICSSELEYEKEDLKMGVCGCMHIKCPLCGYENMIENNENNILLTKNTVEFPTHFYHISKNTGAKDICNNEEIKMYLNKAIDYFRQNKNEYNWYTLTGNLYICVHRYSQDEDYDVIVSNDFYNVEIPFELEDY